MDTIKSVIPAAPGWYLEEVGRNGRVNIPMWFLMQDGDGYQWVAPGYTQNGLTYEPMSEIHSTAFQVKGPPKK